MNKFLNRFFKITAVALSFLCTAILGTGIFLDNYMPSDYKVSFLESQSKTSLPGVTIKNDNLGDTILAENTFSTSSASSNGKLMLCNIIPIKDVTINVTEDVKVIPCGTPFGVKLFTQGVIIVNTQDIATENGKLNPANEAGLEKGDSIIAVNGESISTNEELSEIVKDSSGETLSLTVARNDNTFQAELVPVESTSGDYQVGIWVRDSSAGIGTITFFHEESSGFAGLGHGICDIDTGEIMPLESGDIVHAEIGSITKAVKGTAGSLNGHFYNDDSIGSLYVNTETGVYGVLEEEPEAICKPLSIAHAQEIKVGKAQIIATIDENGPKYYDIEIESINYDENNKTKNMVIKITDEDLINKTGGIVQGMSGSPIIQNDKLVGAVSHVFVNDPEKGYAIFAENMLQDYAKEISNTNVPAA